LLANDIVDQEEFYRSHELIPATKEEIFAESDIVTIHTPLTPLTRQMVNARTLSMMKPTASLVNTARGPIVCQADLKDALERGVLAGAAIDVYEVEPPSDRELLALPNLFCTPHIGGSSGEASRAMGRAVVENLKRHFVDQE